MIVLRLESLALVKLNHMRENPPKPSGTRSAKGSKNPTDTGAIRREGFHATVEEPSETSRSVPIMMKLDAQWIAGFVDGEGCFYIGINRHPEMTAGYQVLPDFTVVQHKRDIQLLHALKAFFGCGIVRTNHGERMAYRVRSIEHLVERIIPFFEKHELQSKKKHDFLKFREVIHLMQRGEHLKPQGIQQIRSIASTMNTSRER